MKTALYNQEGEKTGEVTLPTPVFDVPLNENLVHQVLVVQAARRRQGSAHTKDRSEVSGGGRKPWRQKGTGRARAGSNRSPIWRGGGVTFGPTKDRNYGGRLNDKMRQKALLMILSEKARNNQILMVDGLNIEAPKTKAMAGLFTKLPSHTKSTLFVLPSMDKNMLLSARNIARVKTMQATDLNALDAASAAFLVIPKTAVEVIEKTFVKK
ncbi:MAG: 50S ribosomal protein L4 [Patescibacteria group bacterium]|nr:50S ribosomal protein L4 [Patescibacteria group bacterium]